MDNSPFSKRFGHDLSPDEIKSLFVENRELRDVLFSRQSTFIWGFRGTGKTMLLRYFDIEVQSKHYKDFQEYVKECDFIGFHLNFVCGAFDIPNLDLELDKGNQGADFPVLHNRMAYTISEHLIISAILEKMIKTMAKCMDDSCEHSVFCALAADIAGITKIELVDEYNSATEVFECLAKKINTEKTNVAESLTVFFMGFKEAFEPSQRYMTFEYALKPIVEVFQKRLGREVPIYLLLDDVNNLHIFQQKQLNTWIGQRSHGSVCFKIACEPFEQKAFGTLSNTGRILQKDHDYNELYLDFDTVFKNFAVRKSIYVNVANKRLRSFFQEDQAISIEDLFQESPQQVKALACITEELNQKYPDPKREVYRERWVKLHKESGRVYSGMDDITSLSFGNIREFLSICDGIFRSAIAADGHIQPIPPETQNREILRLSKEFSGRISTLNSFYEKREEDEKLEKLIKNLLSFFRYRLYDTDLAEKSFDAFAVKNQPSLSDDVKEVLRRGIERQFFRKTYYSLKDGNRQDIFVVNKLLFPEHGLNIRETGGKYELSIDLLMRALEEYNAFVKEEKVNPDFDQLTIEGMVAAIDVKEEEPEYEFGSLY